MITNLVLNTVCRCLRVASASFKSEKQTMGSSGELALAIVMSLIGPPIAVDGVSLSDYGAMSTTKCT